MQKPTEITITIDTECSVAGAFANPDKYKPVAKEAILCETDGKENGVGFLLDTFSTYGIKASFFIECAHYYYFGDEPMRSVVKRITDAGQDAQLHVHPCWMSYKSNSDTDEFSTDDSCKGRDYEELKKIFELSIDVFKRWTGKRPDAIRTGSLVADLNVYRVMRDLGVPLSSNVAVGVNVPDEEELYIHSGRRIVEGVMELPVFSYQDMNIFGKKNIKSLQITSCSWPEMKYLLRKARAEGVENIVVLTHPFEYIKKSDPQFSRMIRNRINKERLVNLCRFISENKRDFVSVDFGNGRDRWLQQGNLNEKLVSTPTYYMIGRKLHNKLNDTIWPY